LTQFGFPGEDGYLTVWINPDPRIEIGCTFQAARQYLRSVSIVAGVGGTLLRLRDEILNR
jgi:hypothetical protein